MKNSAKGLLFLLGGFVVTFLIVYCTPIIIANVFFNDQWFAVDETQTKWFSSNSPDAKYSVSVTLDGGTFSFGSQHLIVDAIYNGINIGKSFGIEISNDGKNLSTQKNIR